MTDEGTLMPVQIRLPQEMMDWVDMRRTTGVFRVSRATYLRALITIAKEKLEADEAVARRAA